MFPTASTVRHCFTRHLCHHVKHSNSVTRQKAWNFNEFSPDFKSLSLDECQRCIRSPSDVLVRVSAASINPIDLEIASGFGRSAFTALRFVKTAANDWDQFPLCLGRDFSGVVEAVGPDVRGFRVGDDVIGILSPEVTTGSHATHVVADARLMAHKPNRLDHVSAAAIPYAGLSALSAITFYAGLNSANARFKRVLVLGGSGSVGLSAIAILKSYGADVTATCASNAVDWLRNKSLVDDVISYDNESEFETHAEKYDVVINAAPMSSGSLHMYAVRCLKKKSGAQYVSLTHPILSNWDKRGALIGTISTSADFLSQNAKHLISDGICIKWAFVQGSGKGLEFLADLSQEGGLDPVLHQVFPFDQTPQAYESVSKGHARGKTVIQMPGEESGSQTNQTVKK